ncbi:hypothetical protein NONI108955_44265 [Nocardia ninae]
MCGPDSLKSNEVVNPLVAGGMGADWHRIATDFDDFSLLTVTVRYRRVGGRFADTELQQLPIEDLSGQFGRWPP